jgi:hypothetical protein
MSNIVPNRNFQRPTGGGGGGNAILGSLLNVVLAPSKANAEIAMHEQTRAINSKYDLITAQGTQEAMAAKDYAIATTKGDEDRKTITHATDEEGRRARDVVAVGVGTKNLDKTLENGTWAEMGRLGVKSAPGIADLQSMGLNYRSGHGKGDNIPKPGAGTSPFATPPGPGKQLGSIDHTLSDPVAVAATKTKQTEDFADLTAATSGPNPQMTRGEAFSLSPQFEAHTHKTEFKAAKAANPKLKKKKFTKSFYGNATQQWDAVASTRDAAGNQI